MRKRPADVHAQDTYAATGTRLAGADRIPMNERDLMQIEADTGFTYDERSRMLLSNEPHPASRTTAQRFYLGRTRAGHVMRCNASVPDDVAHRLAEIVAREPADGDLHEPPIGLAAIQQALEQHAPIHEYG